jgi:hypothetical protein
MALAANVLLPSARWGMEIADQDGRPPRLSNGGEADNLGLMSLVRRRLDGIIIADSAQDKRGTCAGPQKRLNRKISSWNLSAWGISTNCANITSINPMSARISHTTFRCGSDCCNRPGPGINEKDGGLTYGF